MMSLKESGDRSQESGARSQERRVVLLQELADFFKLRDGRFAIAVPKVTRQDEVVTALFN
jgi:hypothetical protein